MEKILPAKTVVRGFILTNGEEIIAEVTGPTQRGYMVRNALRVITGLHEGQYGINLIPFSLIAPIEFELYDTMIGSAFPLTYELDRKYNSFVTGIELAPEPSLLQG